jgi:hypothetical protein
MLHIREVFMFKKPPSHLFFVLLLLLSSCSKSLPDQMPDLGIKSDQLEFNTYIKLTVPKGCNSYKMGKFVCLGVENLSDKAWKYNVTKDVLIYQVKNNEWKKVSDNAINIGATEITLGPRGEWPLDSRIIDVLPDVKPDQSAYLRIILIVHDQTIKNGVQIKGAYVDLYLKP